MSRGAARDDGGGATADEAPLDLAIVGAGPCGLAAAVAAKDRGLSYVVLDKGCVAHSLTLYPHYMTFFSTAERLEIGGVPFTIPEPKPTRREALAYYRHVVRRHGLSIRQYQEVVDARREPGTVQGARGGFRLRVAARRSVQEPRASRRTGRDGRRLDPASAPASGRVGPKAPEAATERICARAVAMATGGLGEPNWLDLPVPPSEYDRRIVHRYAEPYAYFDQDVVVVGGGNSAAEAALDLHRNGVRVQMVHFAGKLDRGVKPWVRPDIDNRIASGEIPMHWRSRVADLGDGTAVIASEAGGKRSEVPADWILAMTGWRPDQALLAALGARVDPDTGIPSHDPSTMETSVPGLYVAGVIAAGLDANKVFIENGREHGARIAAHVARRKGPAA